MIVIGIDARSLAGNINGIGRYTFEIVNLLILRNDIKIILYSGKSINLKFNRFVLVRTSSFNNKFINLFWNLFIIGLMARKDKVDIFWEPAHRFPLFLPNIKKVLTIHDLVWKNYPSSMKFTNYLLDRFLMPISLKKSHAIICVSKSTYQEVILSFPFLDPGKISYSYLGISNFVPSNKIRSNISNVLNEKFILFVGTIEPRKNLIRLIYAFSDIINNGHTNIKLYIVGEIGWSSNSLFKLLKLLKLESSVFVFSKVNDSELSHFYSNAIFLCMPSLYEGFGLPIIESFKYGLPVLTSNTSSMKEIAGDAAFLVNPFDTLSISYGLNKLLFDNDLRYKLSKNAFKKSNDFNWTTTELKLYEIFNKLYYECSLNKV